MSDNSPASNSPWKGWNVSTPVKPAQFQDVLSEELADTLVKEDLQTLSDHVQTGNAACTRNDAGWPDELQVVSDSTDSDLLMAQMLQMEYDKEADKLLKREQDHYNGKSKISLSYEKYRNVHPVQQQEVYSDEEEEAVEHKLEAYNLQFNKKNGIRGTGKNMVTKHDLDIASRRNAANAMDKFSLNLDTGDTDRYATKLPNKVYNKLRVHAMAEGKRTARLHEKKDQSTATQAVDQKTRLLLFKMLNDGLLTDVHGVISSGKESAVLHANGGEKEDSQHNRIPVPEEVVLKVFKTTLAEFKNREKYVRGDFRLANEFKKQNPRKIMKMWAEKEMLNLKRMKKFGITCPEVVKLKKHILIMQFIGRNQVPAPKLKDAKLSTDQLMSAYQQIIEGMTSLYRKCCLVHADLSEYNLLWHEGQVFFIDVSQSVDLAHPFAHEFLLRDCKNVVHFFSKHEDSKIEVPSGTELFNRITNMSLDTTVSEEEFLQQIQEYEKEQLAYQLDSQRKEFAFDHMFSLRQQDSDDTDSDDVNDEVGDEVDKKVGDWPAVGEEWISPKIPCAHQEETN
ncbi:serine/threonine-protein kinase RIO3-like [Watersipora subatra]|uniref:serine/threonine-protein kinase RIO3-like n=1 Tax=Watersipora subatra TaxID=2589382 RepID=UPI00355C2E9A